MAYLYDWIKQIVLFILIGTILEMLLPNSSLKKYVHFVFGLLLLLILAKPIFYLFQTDITHEIKLIEEEMEPNIRTAQQTKFSMEKQKEDIQAEQAAYIWNELAEKLKDEANDTLMETYDVQIYDITFDNAQGFITNGELSHLNVYVKSVEEKSDAFKPIEPVVIDKSDRGTEKQTSGGYRQIEQTLRETWQLDDAVTIDIFWEGGTL